MARASHFLVSATLIAASFAPALTYGQQPVVTMEEAFSPKNRLQLVRNIQWVPQEGKVDPKATEYFVYAASDKGKDVLFKKGAASGSKTDTLLKADQLGLRGIPQLTFRSASEAVGNLGDRWVSIKFGAQPSMTTLLTVPKEAENPDPSADYSKLAFTKGNNLFILSDGKEVQVTNETNQAIVSGHSAHQREFGIVKGTFWSPDGSKLAFYRMDQTMIPAYPLVDLLQKPAVYKPLYYPQAGTKSHHVTLGIYDVKTGNTIYIKPEGDPEQYLTNITWSPDGQAVYIALVNRDQNHMQLQRYVAATGKLDKTLFEERHPKYVEPEHGQMFLPTGAPQDQFIWFSERDGYNHLYLYNTSGQLISQLTKGNFDVTSIMNSIYVKNEVVLNIQHTANDGLNRLMAQVRFGKNGKASVSSPYGTVNADFVGTIRGTMSPSGNYMVEERTTPKDYTCMTRELKGNKSGFVWMMKSNPFKVPTPTLVKLKAADGTVLNGRLIKPLNFDSTKKYRTLVYVYGGPHAQLVTGGLNYGADPWAYAFAQDDYVVFTLDNRGSANRGLNFENATHRQLGTVELEDQLVGVKYLKSLKYVDSTRMGINGWSFGGFMTTSMMCRYPDVFKAGCAGGPVIDWSLYEIMYTERYMDSPQQNPEGYAANNLKNLAKNLKGKLMMIHGTDDDVVLWQHTQQMAQQLTKDKKLFEYMIYPGHPHNVGGPDRVHLFRTIKAFFDRSL